MKLELNGKSIFECNETELREAGNLLKSAWSIRQQKATATLAVGQRVEFDSRKGMKVTGTIIKVNQKTVSVSTDQGTWKVSGSLLRPAS